VLRQAGAKILTNSASALGLLKNNNKKSGVVVILVVCNGSGAAIPKALAREIPNYARRCGVVNLAWVFDSVSRGAVLSANDYCPDKNVSAKAL